MVCECDDAKAKRFKGTEAARRFARDRETAGRPRKGSDACGGAKRHRLKRK